MSLLSEIKKKKNNLSPCETIVITPTGDVFKERVLPSGEICSVKSSSCKSFGFVVDPNPDLQVGNVLPNLLLGSQDVAQDFSLLKYHHVTHVLSLGIHIPNLENVFVCKYVDMLDVPETSLRHILTDCLPFIDKALEHQGCVFVHCNAGVSRSASVVIAYLIHTGMSYEQAFSTVKLARPVINPNIGFQIQLKEFEKSLVI